MFNWLFFKKEMGKEMEGKKNMLNIYDKPNNNTEGCFFFQKTLKRLIHCICRLSKKITILYTCFKISSIYLLLFERQCREISVRNDQMFKVISVFKNYERVVMVIQWQIIFCVVLLRILSLR